MEPLSRTDIQESITALYQAAGLEEPDAKTSIVPLGELIQHQNVTCTEVTNLSKNSAMIHLMKRGALNDVWDKADPEPLAGFLYANSHWGSIFVEKNDLLTRRRFSVAHELGHYVLHFQPLLANADPNGEFVEAMELFPKSDSENEGESLPTGHVVMTGIHPNILDAYMQMEHEANQFAADLLMPSPVVMALTRIYQPHFRDDDLVWRLANECLVSRSAMRWRLRDLGLVLPVHANLN